MVLRTIMAGLGFVLLAFTHSYLTFLLVFTGLLASGFQVGFNHASMAAVNHWFLTKQGLAMSILQTGQAIGGVVFLPLVALAVLKLGWRSAAMLSGGAILLTLPWFFWSGARLRAWVSCLTARPSPHPLRWRRGKTPTSAPGSWN